MTYEVKLGDTIRWDGREYVVTYLNHSQDCEGHAIRVDAVDPLRAQAHMDRQKQSREHLEKSLKLLPVIQKLANEMNEGESWKEPKDSA